MNDEHVPELKPPGFTETDSVAILGRTYTCDECDRNFIMERGTRADLSNHTVTCERCVHANEERARALSYLKTPRLFTDATFGSWKFHGNKHARMVQSQVVASAIEYVARFPDVPPLILFSGEPGSGKGHMAYAMCHKLCIDKQTPCRVVKLHAMVRQIREAWSNRSISEDIALQLLYYPELLVIDEVSTHAFYGQPMQHLYDVIDHRIEDCKATIITTNNDDVELASILGPALMSRLAKGGKWNFGRADYRTLDTEETS